MIEEAVLERTHRHELVRWRRGFPLMLCKCGFVSGVYTKIGKNTIDVGAAGAGDVIRWSGAQAALAAGDLAMDTVSGLPRAFIESESKSLVSDDFLFGFGRMRAVQVNKNTALTTLNTHGMTAPTIAGTATNIHVTGSSQFMNYASGIVANDEGGHVSVFTLTRFNRRPIFTIGVRTGGVLTVSRIWVGLFSADPMGSATPAVHLMAFRRDTGAGDANWQAVTDNGSGTPTVTNTSVTVAIDQSERFTIIVDSAGANVRFYIDEVLVATHTTTLPGATTDLGYVCKVRTLEAVAKSFRFSRMSILQKATAL
jgi:hypothetical protein